MQTSDLTLLSALGRRPGPVRPAGRPGDLGTRGPGGVSAISKDVGSKSESETRWVVGGAGEGNQRDAMVLKPSRNSEKRDYVPWNVWNGFI